MKLYRSFETQEEIDHEYDPGRSVADAPALSQAFSQRSAATRRDLQARLDLRYGPTLDEYLDLFPAGGGAPLHIFIHGGYWRRLSARDYSAVAEPLVAAGIAVAVVNYALCPTVTIDEITRQVRACVAWCYANAPSLGCDPGRLTISGHSAGGHLTAMALLTEWKRHYSLPPDILKAGLPVSGLFDLAPFPWSYLQPKLQLTDAEVRRNSPMMLLRPAMPRQLVVVGGAESSEFRRQSGDYADACAAAGNDVAYAEAPGGNHFTVLDALYRPGGVLLPRLLEIAAASG